jgi:haloacetate dehalogenase
MFVGFQKDQRSVNGVQIAYRIGGSGPGLLLLHGHPQTHVIWHKIAEHMSQHFTVVAADLRGYGDSSKPPATEDHSSYSKREMGRDMVELMRELGLPTFSILAHDRGARVAHRLALDHPQAVTRMALLDIAPTLAMYSQTTEAFARAYWHWFFLIRPAPLPNNTCAASWAAAARGWRRSPVRRSPSICVACACQARRAGCARITAPAPASTWNTTGRTSRRAIT